MLDIVRWCNAWCWQCLVLGLLSNVISTRDSVCPDKPELNMLPSCIVLTNRGHPCSLVVSETSSLLCLVRLLGLTLWCTNKPGFGHQTWTELRIAGCMLLLVFAFLIAFLSSPKTSWGLWTLRFLCSDTEGRQVLHFYNVVLVYWKNEFGGISIASGSYSDTSFRF
jgi:hypothetical protein